MIIINYWYSCVGGGAVIKSYLEIGTLAFTVVLGITPLHASARDEEQNIVLPDIEVTESAVLDAQTEGSDSYQAPASTLGTKVATQSRDIPQSISVITQERIRDQSLRTTQEALEQVASVSKARDPENAVLIRGFSAQTMVNGVPTTGLVGRTQADIAVFDRVEVLKGPAGLLTGAGSPGGAINYELKKPQRDFHSELSLGTGSDNTHTEGIDVTGPLNTSGTLRGRGVLFRDKADEFVDVEKHERTSRYGVLEYDLTDDTSASVGYYQQRNNAVQGFRQGLPAYTDGGLLNVDRRTSMVQDWSRWRFKSDWLLADIVHRFNDDWQAKLSYREGKNESPTWYSQPKSFNGDVDPESRCSEQSQRFEGVVKGAPNGGRRCYNASFYDDRNRYKDADAFIAGKFSLLGRDHDVVLGTNWDRTRLQRGPFDLSQGSNDFENDVFAPSPHVTERPLRREYSAYDEPLITHTHGVYTRAALQLNDWLKLPLGGRLTWSESDTGETLANREFTPYAGLVAELDKHWTVYTSYADIFNPQTYGRAWSTTKPNGELLPNQKGKQYETGVKSAWFDDRLTATAAIYQLTLENTTRDDRDHPGFAIATGEQQTRGVEIEVNGEVLPRWNVGVAYALMNTRYNKSDIAEGKRVENTPLHTATLYTNYHFPEEGWRRGLSIGGGIRAQSGIEGEPAGGDNSEGTARVEAPGYAITYLRAGYALNRHAELSLNLDNVFDKTYWQQLGSTAGGNYYGSPRTLMANLNLSY